MINDQNLDQLIQKLMAPSESLEEHILSAVRKERGKRRLLKLLKSTLAAAAACFVLIFGALHLHHVKKTQAELQTYSISSAESAPIASSSEQLIPARQTDQAIPLCTGIPAKQTRTAKTYHGSARLPQPQKASLLKMNQLLFPSVQTQENRPYQIVPVSFGE